MKTHALTLLLFGVLHSLAAAEETEKPKPAPKKEIPPVEAAKTPAKKQIEEPAKAEREKITYLGVITRSLSPELTAQLGLAPGFGLLVEELMPESPAHKAGLKRHDVLLRFNDQRLVNMEQLQVLVRAEKAGQKVTLSLISGGKEGTVQAVLAEREMEPMERQGLPMPPSLRPGGSHPSGERMPDWEQRSDRFRQQMREYQERLKDWQRDNQRGPMPQIPFWEAPAGEKPAVRKEGAEKPKSQGRTIRRDESGEYVLTREGNGELFFEAKPIGAAGGRWAVESQEQREQLPDRFQSKLKELLELQQDAEARHRQSR